MLFTETVDPNTLSILKTLLQLKELKDFYLVGGTALSLMYGHRKSIDLDLFCVNDFDKQALVDKLVKKFGTRFQYEGKHNRFGIFAYIDDVKVDLVYYPHPIIEKVIIEDRVRMYHPKDIIAMKAQAVLGRGKKKDFYDIAMLLENYSIKDFIEMHKLKYPNQQYLISIPLAFTYFDDADESEDAISLKKQTWSKVKKIIQKKVSEYLR